MCGESKYVLSTYCIKLCHGKNIFDHMLDRIGKMDLNGSFSINIIGFRKLLNKEWHNHYGLLTRVYERNHLNKSDMDQLYCCKFALGGNCKHSNKENSCIKCLTCFSFFKKKVFLS